MELASRFSGIGNVITAGLNLYQTADCSARAQALEQTRHEQELELVRQQHRKELLTAKQTYLISTFTDIEQYCQELNENLVNSTKDAERDMVDQRSQQFQTILLAGTIMIASVISILIEGTLDEKANQFSKIAYSFSISAAIAFIGLNMLLCIQLIYRVTQFMYRRSEANLTQLRDAMSETKKMMRRIRGDDGSSEHVNINSIALASDLPEEGEGDQTELANGTDGVYGAEEEKMEPEEDAPRMNYCSSGGPPSRVNLNKNPSNKEKSGPAGGGKGGIPLQRNPSNRSHISSLTHAEVDDQWEQHEMEVHAYLHHRSAINERREVLRFGAVSFEHFWNTSCRDAGFLALVSFYIGTSLVLIATMIHMWSLYVIEYECREGAVVAVLTIGISLVVCLGFAIYLRFFDPSINHMRGDTTVLAAADGDQPVKYD